MQMQKTPFHFIEYVDDHKIKKKSPSTQILILLKFYLEM